MPADLQSIALRIRNVVLLAHHKVTATCARARRQSAI